MKKVKFGIIGAGMIARMHAKAIRPADNAALTVVYDKVTERAERFASENGCAFAADFQRFLNFDIDAVTIAVPSGMHGEATVAAANAKKHILCENRWKLLSKNCGIDRSMQEK